MKIGDNNFALKDSHLDREKKVNKVSASGKKDSTGTDIQIKNTNLQIKDSYLQIQRNISVVQTRLTGFLHIREWLENEKNLNTAEENFKYMSELINNIQIKGEKVLQAYEDELTNILKENSIQKMDSLISETENEINGYLNEINKINQAKTNTAEQNLLAAQSNTQKKDLNELMQDVVNKIKQSDNPGINIAREKIIDLL